MEKTIKFIYIHFFLDYYYCLKALSRTSVSLTLKQWLSSGGDLAPCRGYFWRYFWLSQLGKGCYWNLVGRSQEYCKTFYSTQNNPPMSPTKYPAQNLSSAEFICFKERSNFWGHRMTQRSSCSQFFQLFCFGCCHLKQVISLPWSSFLAYEVNLFI